MLRLVLCLSLVGVALVQGFLLDDSCQGRCGSRVDSSRPCQCNTACVRYNDCCSDYTSTCTSGGTTTCEAFSKVTEQLWANDVDRLSSYDVMLDYQAQVYSSDFRDKAPEKLFTYVNEAKLKSSTLYSTYLTLLDNYDPDKYDPELSSPQELAEEQFFMDALLASPTIKVLYDYLRCQGKVASMTEMRSVLERLWFEPYNRSPSSSTLDTSGFEHVMVGEFKSSSQVNGMHYWLSFYQLEKSGNIEYYGHSCSTRPNTLCAAFTWNGREKQKATFFLRSSPAFDIAMYTLCFIMYPGQDCPVLVDGRTMTIKTYSSQGHVATAFVQ